MGVRETNGKDPSKQVALDLVRSAGFKSGGFGRGRGRGHGSGRSRDGSERVQRDAMAYVTVSVANFVAIPPNSCSPSNPVKHGWRYPGVGEFQCYDQYMLKSLTKAAEAREHSFWARGPENEGSYNSRPHETAHGDWVLTLAKLAFEGICITTKINTLELVEKLVSAGHPDPICFHWWYKTAGHFAELTACFYNPSNHDGYAAIMQMLKKHGVALNFKSAQMCISYQHMDSSKAFGDPDGLAWQVSNDDTAVAQIRLEDKQPEENTNTDCLVKERENVHLGIKVGANITVTGVPGQEGAEGGPQFEVPALDEDAEYRLGLCVSPKVMNAAWDSGIPITSENALPCLDKVSYNHLLEKAKPPNDPDGRHYSAFTYLRLGPHLMEPHNIMESERFVKRMHGKLHSLLVKDIAHGFQFKLMGGEQSCHLRSLTDVDKSALNWLHLIDSPLTALLRIYWHYSLKPGPEEPEQAPPSPDYVPGPEHDDDEIVAEDQPYAEDASPIAQSPDYVPESDPEADPEEDGDEDPEEDPIDYPADGGDDGDDEMDIEEDEDADMDIDEEDEDDEMDDEEAEEEHSAPAYPVVVALPATAPSAEETEPFETDESAATPPPHPAYRMTARITIPEPLPVPAWSDSEVARLLAISSPPASPLSPCPIRSLGYRAATIRMRAEAAATSHSLPLPPPFILSPTRPDAPPPMPTSAPTLFPPLLREDRPEVNLPPRMGLGIALGPRYEVGESSAAAAARPARGLRADYGFVATMDREIRCDPERYIRYGITDSWDEIVETLQGAPVSTETELGAHVRDFKSMVRRETDEIYTRLDDEQSQYPRAGMSREAWGWAMDASDLAHGEVISLRTTVHAQMSEITELQSADFRRQRAMSDLLETDRKRREEMRELRAADRTRQQQIIQTLTVMQTLQREMVPLQGLVTTL
ncbi:putative reverse transcriptase domain-containing protein [Tanacetum coccineum]